MQIGIGLLGIAAESYFIVGTMRLLTGKVSLMGIISGSIYRILFGVLSLIVGFFVLLGLLSLFIKYIPLNS